MKLPKELTIVTPLSKYLAMILFIVLPIVGFFLGIRYQEILDLAKRQQMENNLSVTRIPTPTPDETANWKTYRNTKYSFELNYPPDWIFNEEKRQDQPSALLYIGFRPEFTPAKSRPVDYVNDVAVISLSIQKNSKSLEEIIKMGSCHAGPESCTPYENVIDLVVAGLPAKKVSPPDILPTDRVFLKQNGRLYLFLVRLDESFVKSHSLTVEDKRKIFDQILSTFKFTSP